LLIPLISEKIPGVWTHLSIRKQVLLAQRTSSTAFLYALLNLFINKWTGMY